MAPVVDIRPRIAQRRNVDAVRAWVFATAARVLERGTPEAERWEKLADDLASPEPMCRTHALSDDGQVWIPKDPA